MIDLYAWKTSNCRKVSIMLEECGVDYSLKLVNLEKKEQFSPEFLSINPNNKVPAIVDNEKNVTIFESGAILIYLAEKYKKFLSTDEPKRSRAIEWLMFQMSAIGPILGQVNFFSKVSREKLPLAIKRFEDERDRILKVVEGVLQKSDYLAGDYSIADIASYPGLSASIETNEDEYPAIKKWVYNIASRPAVKKGWDFGGK